MNEMTLACEQKAGDSIECCVVGDGVFLDIRQPDRSADIKLSPEKARELAEWLKEAADKAEACDE